MLDRAELCSRQSVMCLNADMCLTADQGFASLIPSGSLTFVENF